MRKSVLGLCILAMAASVVATGCHKHHVNNLPPSKMLMEPGPGVGGPGPGVMLGALPTVVPLSVSQMAFVGPGGMRVAFDSSGDGFFDSEPLVAPARQNFQQGAIYRLKLTSIPGHPGEEYYPTLEIGPTTPRTEAYLAHNAVPVQLIPEDFDQVQSGNFVTKVIYLPDPEYQKLALAAIETLVSTRLDPGVDPIKEADRRGAILAILRLGNKDLSLSSGAGMAGGVHPVSYETHAGLAAPHPSIGVSPSLIAGVNAPQYGMPISGTPIGLPGPPHVPLGIPAGLQMHRISNHTIYDIPPPVRDIKIDVEQKPGYSYPKPPRRANIVEEASKDKLGPFKQPFGDKFEWLRAPH